MGKTIILICYSYLCYIMHLIDGNASLCCTMCCMQGFRCRLAYSICMRLGNRSRAHSSFFAFLVVMYPVSYLTFIAKCFFLKHAGDKMG
jgi:hypothetical protein